MNHLVVYKRIKAKNYIEWIFEGTKSVDIRFQHNRRFPWASLKIGDSLYIKESSGPVVGVVNIKSVQYKEISSWQESFLLLRSCVGKLHLRDEEHLSKICRKNEGKKYLIIFELANPILFNRYIYISKKDQRSWVKNFPLTSEIMIEEEESISSIQLRKHLSSCYNLELPTVVPVDRGSINKNYLVKNKEQTFFLKNFSDLNILGYRRNKNIFKDEEEYTSFLSSNGINIPQILKTNDRRYYFNLHNKQFALYSYVRGEQFTHKDELSLHITFKLLGKIHKATVEGSDCIRFKKKWRGGLFYQHFSLKECPLWISKNIKSSLKKELVQVDKHISEMSPILKKNSKYPIHGDVGPHNILRQGQKLYLLDFDNSRIGHLEEDFGISLALFKYFRRDEEKEVLLRECLKIYSTVYKDNDINIDLVRMYAQLMLVRLKYLYGSGKFILNEKIFM